MTPARYFKGLGITTLIAAILLAIPAYLVPGWFIHNNFSLAIVGLFIFISLLIYFLGQLTVKSPEKAAFHGVIMGSVLFKLALGLAALFFYARKFHPENNLFIWVFLITYIVYTVWEVKFMTILAKTK